MCYHSTLLWCLLLCHASGSAIAYPWARGCSSASCAAARARCAALCSVAPGRFLAPCTVLRVRRAASYSSARGALPTPMRGLVGAPPPFVRLLLGASPPIAQPSRSPFAPCNPFLGGRVASRSDVCGAPILLMLGLVGAPLPVGASRPIMTPLPVAPLLGALSLLVAVLPLAPPLVRVRCGFCLGPWAPLRPWCNCSCCCSWSLGYLSMCRCCLRPLCRLSLGRSGSLSCSVRLPGLWCHR